MKNINDIDVCTLTDEELENLTEEEIHYLVEKLEEKYPIDDDYTLSCWYNMDEESRLNILIDFEKEERGLIKYQKFPQSAYDSLCLRAKSIVDDLKNTARNY